MTEMSHQASKLAFECERSDRLKVKMVRSPPGTDQWIIVDRWERLAALLPGIEEADGAAASHSHHARTEAATRLISNHEGVFRDTINPSKTIGICEGGRPLSQLELSRVHPSDARYVDEVLRETARRLLGRVDVSEVQLDPSSSAQTTGWGRTVLFLLSRLQSLPNEVPGRAPDMSCKAALAMRAVLNELGCLALSKPT